jgi:ankyrin repeat protein
MGFGPETDADWRDLLICPKCGGEVTPLNSDVWRTLLAKRAAAEASGYGAKAEGQAPIEGSGEVNVDHLVEQVAQRMIQNEQDQSLALHKAAKAGKAEEVRRLLNAGSDVEARDGAGMTPLYLAASEGHQEVVELLLNHGAYVNARDAVLGASPLQRAATFGHAEVVRVLLERGADVNFGSSGESALQLAKKRGFSQVVEILRAYGAKG